MFVELKLFKRIITRFIDVFETESGNMTVKKTKNVSKYALKHDHLISVKNDHLMSDHGFEDRCRRDVP
jgi:hypothetical protein